MNIKPIFDRLLEYKLYSLDLRNVKISCARLLGLLLVHQPNLKKLNLSNAFIDEMDDFIEVLSKKDTVPQSQLEELRMTHLSNFHLRYHLIAKLYPNIQRLYIGNNSLTISDFHIITSSMKNLRLLEISYNPDVERSIGSLTLSSLHSSSLATIFFHGGDDLADSLTKSTGIHFIGNTIWDILSSIRKEDELYILESWLESG